MDFLLASANTTRQWMLALVKVHSTMKETIRQSALRADTAHALVDLAVSQTTFDVRRVERTLGIGYGRANRLINSLVDLEILRPLGEETYKCRFYAPTVLGVFLTMGSPESGP